MNDQTHNIGIVKDVLGPWERDGNTKPLIATFTEDAAKQFQKLSSTVELTSFQPKQFFAQDDRVIVLGTAEGNIMPSEKTINGNWALVFTLKDGRVSGYSQYCDTANLETVATTKAHAA